MRKQLAAFLRALANILAPMPRPVVTQRACRHKDKMEAQSPLSRFKVYECLECGERIRGEPIGRRVA